jgi:nucleoside-diphosphate-sugar epimerase
LGKYKTLYYNFINKKDREKNMSIKSALVTGGAGFIGSHIVEALVQKGCRVTVLDNLASGHLSNLKSVADRIRFIEGDICDQKVLSDAVCGCEVVFHEAAVVSVTDTVNHPLSSARVNELGTINVLEAAKQHNARRVILASSSAVYGDDPKLPKQESMAPKPLSPYAVQKLAGEYHAGVYTNLYGLETVCLRYFNVFGPRQDPRSPYSGVISIFMARAARKEKPIIYGDGTYSRDFIYVKDVVAANLLAATNTCIKNGVYNVGTGQSVQILRLWELICKLTNLNLSPNFEAVRPGDVPKSIADITTTKTALAFLPQVSFKEGLKKTFEYYLEN